MGRAVGGREHAAVLGAAIPTPGARVHTVRSWLAVAPVYKIELLKHYKQEGR